LIATLQVPVLALLRDQTVSLQVFPPDAKLELQTNRRNTADD